MTDTSLKRPRWRQRFDSLPLRQRFVLLMLVPLVIALLSLLVLSRIRAYALQVNLLARTHEQTVSQVMTRITAGFQSVETTALVLTHSSALGEMLAEYSDFDRATVIAATGGPGTVSQAALAALEIALEQAVEPVTDELTRLLSQRAEVMQVTFIGPNGFELLRVSRSADGAINVAEDDALQDRTDLYAFQVARGLSVGQTFATSPGYNSADTAAQTAVVQFATPLFTSGRFAGVLVLDAQAASLLRDVASPESGERQLLLVDADGYYLADTRGSDALFGRSRDADARLAVRDPILAAIPGTTASTVHLGGNFVTSLSFDPLPGVNMDHTPWTLIVLEGDVAALSEDLGYALGLIGAALLMLGLSILVAYALGRRLTRPLEAASDAALQIANGNLTLHVPVHAHDEVGRLAEAINTLTSNALENIASLEDRVQDRTRDIEVVSEIASVTVGIQDVHELLARTMNLIRDRFNFYHVQVFLVDTLRHEAQLVASTGEAGRTLLELRWSLPVGGRSVIGQVTASGENVLVYDTTAPGSTHRPNPHLPDTRAEMALPLKIKDEVIGALDIQSSQPQAFDQADVAIFEVLARQLAIAVANARLLAERSEQVNRMAALTRQLTRESWNEFLIQQTDAGASDYSLENAFNGDAVGEAVQIPIRLRDEVIGHLNTALAGEQETLDEDDLELLEAVGERLALAVENARLVQQTQASLAETERLYQTSRAINLATDDAGTLLALHQNFGQPGRILGLLLFDRPLRGDERPGGLRVLFILPGETQAHLLSLAPATLGEGFVLPGRFSPEQPYLMVSDPQAMRAAYPAPMLELAAAYHVQSLVSFPLEAGGYQQGRLLVMAQQAGPLAAREADLFSAIAGQVATVLRTRQLFDDVQAEQQTLRSVLSAMPTAVLVLDAEGRVTIANEQAEALFGGSADLGRLAAAQRFVTPDDEIPLALDDLPVMRALHSGEAVMAENLSIIADDQWRTSLLSNAAPILDENGNIVAAVTVFQDISELRELQSALQETLRDTTAQYEASQNIFAATSRDAIAAAILDHAVQNLAPDLVQIVLLPQADSLGRAGDTREMTLLQVLAARPATAASADFYPPEVLALDSTTIISDLAANRQITPPGRAALKERGLSALMTTPLTVGSDVLGWLCMGYTEPRAELSRFEQFFVSLADQAAIALQNALLRLQTEEALNETLTLYGASREIGRAMTTQEILETFITYTLPQDAIRASILVFDKSISSAEMRTQVVADWSRSTTDTHLFIGKSITLGTDDMDFIIKLDQEQPVLMRRFAEAGSEFRLSTALRDYLLAGERPGTVLGLPMLVGGRLIGALNIGFEGDHEQNEREKRMYQSLVDQVATAIENRRLLETTRESLEQTERLYSSSALIAAAREPVDLLRAVLDTIQHGMTSSALCLYDRALLPGQQPRWMRVVAVGTAQSVRRTDMVLDYAPDSPELEGLAPLLAGEPLLLYRFDSEPDLLTERSIRALRLHKAQMIASFGLRSGGRLLGALTITSNTPYRLNNNEISTYTALADQIGVALQSRNLLDQTQRLFHASQNIRAASSVGEVLVVLQSLLMAYEPVRLDIYLQQTEEGTARLRRIHHWETPDSASGTLAGLADRINAGERELSLDVLQRAPLYIERREALVASPLAESYFAVHPNAQAMVSIPLHLRNQPVGRLVAVFDQERRFFEDDQNYLASLADQSAIVIDNYQLIRQTQDSLDETRVLYETSNSLAEVTSAQDILDAIIRHTADKSINQARLLILEGASWDDPSALVQVAASWSQGDFAPDLTGMRFTAEQYPGWSQIARHDFLAIEDVAAAPDLSDDERLSFLALEVFSLILIPLEAAGKPLGTVMLGSEEVHAHSARELRIYRNLADLVTISLQNTRLLSQIQRRARQLQTSAEISQAITSILSLEDLLPRVVDLIRTSFEYDHVQIFLVDDTTQNAVLQASTGEAGKTLLGLRWTLPVGSDSVIGQVTARAEPVIALDTADAKVPHRPNPYLPDTRSEIAVPLLSRGAVAGALDVQSSLSNAFDQEDVQVLTSLADQIGIALGNARLFEDVQQARRDLAMQVEQLEQLLNASRNFASLVNAEEILFIAAAYITQLLGIDHCGIALVDAVTPSTATLRAEYPDRGNVGLVLQDADWWRSPYEQSSQPVVVDDLTAPHAIISEATRQVLLGAGIKQVAVVPFFAADGSLLGTIGLDMYERRRQFLPGEITVLQLFANQLAAAYNSALLFAQTERNAADQKFLFDATTAAATAFGSLGESMEQVLELVSEHITSDLAVLYLTREDATAHLRLEPLACFSTGTDLPLPQTVTLDIGETALDRVAVNRALVMVEDFKDYDLPAVLPGLQSMIATPLLSGANFLGVLALFRRATATRNDDTLRLLQTLAGSLSVIVENSRLLDEVQAANMRLRELDKLKSQFLANMSHELRTPLNSIIGFSRVILKGIDGPLTDMQHQDLETIHSSGNHLLTLINDILDQAKIESNKLELNITSFDLIPAIEAARSMTIGLIKERPVRLQVELEPGLPYVWGDELRTRQIMINLLNNAAKFTREGSITLSAFTIQSKDGDYVQVSVSDTGIGIPNDKFDVVFNQFEQVDGSLTRNTGGTGLGLPISKSLVELQGGEIWLESTVGIGTTFSFTVPAFQKVESRTAEEYQEKLEAEAAPTRSPLEEEPALPRRIVLVVDDEVGMHQLYRRYLNKAGYTVEAISNSLSAHERAVILAPEVIILDVQMPQMDGWQVLERIKDDDRTYEIPVIVCSIENDTERSFRLGAAEHLVKPFLEEELLGALRRVESERMRYRILIIDDKPETVRLIAEWLRRDNRYEVLAATSGVAGLEAIHARPPDLVLLDLNMPDLDGKRVLQALRGSPATHDIPVMIITSEDIAPWEGALDGLTIFSKHSGDERTLLDGVRALLEAEKSP